MPPLLRAVTLLAFASAAAPLTALPAESQPAPQQDAMAADSPRPTLTMEPEYPHDSKRVPGTVVMIMVVDKTGIPRNVKVKKHLTDDEDSAAVEAVKQWRFRPGMRDGKPVAVKATVAVTFHPLDGPKK